jgi:4'-phosphopantetheinyl transferase EntD
MARNYTKKIHGYRVRIFSDNSQAARQRAFEVEATFKALYPDVPTYASYQDLYFKVTVGDFRTRTDAMRFLSNVQRSYPGAYIVKENINFPSL